MNEHLYAFSQRQLGACALEIIVTFQPDIVYITEGESADAKNDCMSSAFSHARRPTGSNLPAAKKILVLS